MTANLKSVTEGIPPGLTLSLVITGSPATGSQDQRHTGFLVQYPDKSLWLFDLAWDKKCRREKIPFYYAYLAQEFLDPFNANAVIALLHMIQLENENTLGYGIHYEDDHYFDEGTGKALKTSPGQGLTCATFVIETLNRYGIKLIDKASWPITTANADWQRGILIAHMSRANPADFNRYESQLKYIGKTRRFRPEEAVGAASIFSGTPITYQMAAPEAKSVVSELSRLRLL